LDLIKDDFFQAIKLDHDIFHKLT